MPSRSEALTGRFRRLRHALRAGGAGDSGLASLTELCAINSAADTLVTIALAGTLFFAVPAGQARGKVAVYLLVTMAPFAVLAPLIGPLLDRARSGRRLGLAVTMLARAGLALALADHEGGLALYPIALGVLVGSRSFGLLKSAVVPRVVPPTGTLVGANSRLQMTGVITAVIVGPLAAGLAALAGGRWVLRLAAVVFAAGVLLAMTLPARVDSAEGEERARGLGSATVVGVGHDSSKRRRFGGVPQALRASAALRGLVGFLTLFLAFQLRGHGSGTAALAALAVAAGLGNAVGVTIGSRLSRRGPEALLAAALAVGGVACLAGALAYSVTTAVLVALAVTVATTVGKLSLDAIIQRDVDPAVRASAFARSETTLQLAWVCGGALGLLPVGGTAGFVLVTAVLASAAIAEVVAARRASAARPAS